MPGNGPGCITNIVVVVVVVVVVVAENPRLNKDISRYVWNHLDGFLLLLALSSLTNHPTNQAINFACLK
jgi:hypothetical protein